MQVSRFVVGARRLAEEDEEEEEYITLVEEVNTGGRQSSRAD